MATYPHNISSVHATHPDLPPMLGALDLSQAINAGDPLSQQNLDHARYVPLALKGLCGSGDEPLVTAAIAERAHLGEIAIESAHASANYIPGDLLQQLQEMNNRLGNMNNRLGGIEDRLTAVEDRLIAVEDRLTAVDNRINNAGNQLAEIKANTFNLKATASNLRRGPAEPLRPLQKTIPGHGYNKAFALRAGVNINQPNQTYDVGTIPPQFVGDISNYQHINILNLIVFYNDDFGIIVSDNLGARQNKVRTFLVGFDL